MTQSSACRGSLVANVMVWTAPAPASGSIESCAKMVVVEQPSEGAPSMGKSWPFPKIDPASFISRNFAFWDWESPPVNVTTHHSSQGGALGERADPVQDAIFTCAGGAGASVLDRIEAASPILCAGR